MSATNSPMLGSDKDSFSVEVAKAQPHNAAPLASVSTAPKTPKKFMMPVLLLTCVLAVSISICSSIPVITVSAFRTQGLGYDLLAEVSAQHFHVLYANIQAALDEADYWVNFMDSWLRHQEGPLVGYLLEPRLKQVMLPWMEGVAKRVGGICTMYPDEYVAGNQWEFCASRMDLSGRRDLFWEHFTNTTIMYRDHVDAHWNLGATLESWDASPSDKGQAYFALPDRGAMWVAPWLWTENRPDGTSLTLTEVGQYRMTRVNGTRVVHFLWMQDTDWVALLRLTLQKFSGGAADASTAYLVDGQGKLIAATCGSLVAGDVHQGGKLVAAEGSDCAVVALTYRALPPSTLVDGRAPMVDSVETGGYLVSWQHIVTSRGDATPYRLVLATPYSAVDGPIRWSVSLLVIISVSSLAGVAGAAVLFASRTIAAPLRQIAWDMHRCVELDLASTAASRGTCVRELSLMMDSFAKMRVMLDTVARFLPVEVLQPCLKHGTPIALSMVPTRATVFFLDIENFTALTESTDAALLVESIGTFFGELSTIIVQRCGVIDKYIGDCVMAFWNTPSPVPDHEFRACSAALACAEWMLHGQAGQGLRLTGRMGLEAGQVRAGIFGSRHRMNYTVVGDVVNVASRLEGLNKERHTRILLGPQLHAAVEGRVVSRRLEDVHLKGKTLGMVAYELLGLADDPLNERRPPTHPYALPPIPSCSSVDLTREPSHS